MALCQADVWETVTSWDRKRGFTKAFLLNWGLDVLVGSLFSHQTASSASLGPGVTYPTLVSCALLRPEPLPKMETLRLPDSVAPPQKTGPDTGSSYLSLPLCYGCS